VLNRRRFAVGAALIVAAVSYLVYAGIRSTSTYYFEMDEFLAARQAHAGQTLRVKGWVGAINRDDARTNRLEFDLTRKDGSAAVPVAYTGIKPDMFSAGREVVVEGRWDGERLAAQQIMTSCPSKYEAAPAEAS
jgi:cytochrome c-type biogenesis protein CcmE